MSSIGSTVIGGSVEVVEAQKPVKLTEEPLKVPCLGVWVGADSGNVGKNCAIGHSKAGTEAKLKSGKGLMLHEFDKLFIAIGDPSQLWVDVESSKDKVTWLAVLA